METLIIQDATQAQIITYDLLAFEVSDIILEWGGYVLVLAIATHTQTSDNISLEGGDILKFMMHYITLRSR
jgi:hypothetical protein